MINQVNGTTPGLQDAEAAVYNIGAVSRMLGLDRATIRNWEDRFELVRPERSTGGHRLFSGEEVQRLRFVAELVADGVRPAAAHRRLQEHLAHERSLPVHEPIADAALSRVLLVEPDWRGAELTKHCLRSEGYEVITVDADGALSSYEQLRPQLAIVDLFIPGGAGLPLCRSLKEQGLSGLIAIAALPMPEQALEAGADAFLLKPIDPLQLISSAKDLVSRDPRPTLETLAFATSTRRNHLANPDRRRSHRTRALAAA